MTKFIAVAMLKGGVGTSKTTVTLTSARAGLRRRDSGTKTGGGWREQKQLSMLPAIRLH